MSLLIIFGAGASFDTHPLSMGKAITDDRKLPLANGLFGDTNFHNAKKTIYPVAAVESRVKEAFVKDPNSFDIEEIFYKLAKESERRPNLEHQLFVSRFYIRSVIESISENVLQATRNMTTYVNLLRALDDWQQETDLKTDIVTFNYDNLIEESLRQVHGWSYPGDGARNFDQYYKNTDIPSLYKVHGSVNWWREAVSGEDDYTHYAFESCWGVWSRFIKDSYGDYIFSKDPNRVGKANRLYMPSIALPLKDKTNFDDCPSEIIEDLRKKLKKVEYILIIGWKAADLHFISELKSHSKKIKKVYIVNPSYESGNIVLERMSGLSTQFQRVDEGFRDFVEAGSLQEVLADIKFLKNYQ